MTVGLAVILLAFALMAYGGAGACLAVARRRAAEEEPDLGVLGVAVLLLGLAVLCSAVLGGLAAVLAVGVPVTVALYLFSAQQIGLFRVGRARVDAVPAEESPQRG